LGHPHDIVFDRTIYEYDLNKHEWNPINIFCEKTNNTIESGTEKGPPQVYEHQMAFDTNNQDLYLFGGVKLPISDDENGKLYLYRKISRTLEIKPNRQILGTD
jgi:hypothetical protein